METTVRTSSETHHVIIHSSAREAMNTNEVILLKHVPKEFLLTIDSLCCSQRDLIVLFCWAYFPVGQKNWILSPLGRAGLQWAQIMKGFQIPQFLFLYLVIFSDLTLVDFLRHCCSSTKSCPTLCNPMDCSMLDFPVLHHLPEFAQTHVHWVGDAIQPSHALSSPLSLPSIFPNIRVFSKE